MTASKVYIKAHAYEALSFSYVLGKQQVANSVQ